MGNAQTFIPGISYGPHRIPEAGGVHRRLASSCETFILFFYLVLEVATSIRYPRMNVPRALFLRLGSSRSTRPAYQCNAPWRA